MDKIEAARHGSGLITVENDSAVQVKQAIEQVSNIMAMDGDEISFEGQRIIEGHGFALRINAFDIYECPRGYLLHTYNDKGPNWAVAGQTLKEMLAAAPDRAVARRAEGLLVQKNYFSIHQH